MSVLNGELGRRKTSKQHLSKLIHHLPFRKILYVTTKPSSITCRFPYENGRFQLFHSWFHSFFSTSHFCSDFGIFFNIEIQVLWFCYRWIRWGRTMEMECVWLESIKATSERENVSRKAQSRSASSWTPPSPWSRMNQLSIHVCYMIFAKTFSLSFYTHTHSVSLI